MRYLLFLFCFTASVAHAAPDLSAAYAKPAMGLVLTLEKQSQEFSSPGEMPKEAVPQVVTDPATTELLRMDYERGLRQHRTGVILTIVGGVLVPVTTFGLFVGAFAGDPALATMSALGLVVSSGVYIGGGVLSSLGAIQATRAVNDVLGIDLSLGAGWAGVALSTAGLLLAPVAGIGLFGPLAGALCGVVQLQTANRELERAGLASLHLVPTGNGLAVVGRF